MGRVKAMLYDWRDDDDGTPETRTPTPAQREILHAEQDAADDLLSAIQRAEDEEWDAIGGDGDEDDDLAESLAVERAIDDRTQDVDFGADDFGGFFDL